MERDVDKSQPKLNLVCENVTEYRIKQLSESETFEIMFRELVNICHDTALDKGWWNPGKTPGEQIALFHAEISEALEELRNGSSMHEIYYKDGKPAGFPVELADCIIRIFDTCGNYNIPILEALFLKMLYNLTRPHRHGNKVL